MAKFTDIFIKSLKPRQNRYDIREPDGSGLGVRVAPGGTITWCFWYTHLGRKRRMTLGRYPAMSLKAANAARDAAAVLLARELDPAEQRELERTEKQRQRQFDRQQPTVTLLVAEFMAHHAAVKFRPNTLRQYATRFERHILPVWGQRKMASITQRDVSLLRRSVSGTYNKTTGQWSGAPSEADRVVSLVRLLFKYAVDEGLVEVNPARLVMGTGATKPRERALDDAELRFLLEQLPHIHLNEVIKHAIRFMLLTARRVQEVTGLSFEEIDFDKKLWTLPEQRNKSKRVFTLPLSRQALRVLEEWQRLAVDQWVFPSPLRVGQPINANAVTNGLKRCFRNGEFGDIMQPFTAHDIRRSVRTGLERIGIDPFTSERVLDHSQGRLIQTYNKHDYLAEIGMALQHWADHLDSLTGQAAAGNVVVLKR